MNIRILKALQKKKKEKLLSLLNWTLNLFDHRPFLLEWLLTASETSASENLRWKTAPEGGWRRTSHHTFINRNWINVLIQFYLLYCLYPENRGMIQNLSCNPECVVSSILHILLLFSSSWVKQGNVETTMSHSIVKYSGK